MSKIIVTGTAGYIGSVVTEILVGLGFEVIGIVIRILSLLFRKAFVKKRKQKLSQYLLKMKQYLSFKNQIFKSSYFIAALTDENKKQIIYKDSFWQ